MREDEQHLVVVQRQPVLALELRGQLAGDRRMRPDVVDPGRELLGRCGELRHSCALKCSAERPAVGASIDSPMGRTDTSSREAGIEVHGLVRRFKDVEAVAGIDLDDQPGRDLRVAGAERRRQVDHGGTCSHTLLPPSAGSATVAGVRHRQARGQGAGFDRRRAPGGGARPVPDRPRAPAPRRLAARGSAARARKQLIERLLDRVGLSSAGDRKVRTYSGGMKRRLDLALALIHDPCDPLPRRADDRARPAEQGPRSGQRSAGSPAKRA